MKRTFFSALALATAMFGATASQPVATSTPRTGGQTAELTNSTQRVPHTPKQAPAQATRAVKPSSNLLAMAGPQYFHQKQGLRKVTYGKHKWIILG